MVGGACMEVAVAPHATPCGQFGAHRIRADCLPALVRALQYGQSQTMEAQLEELERPAATSSSNDEPPAGDSHPHQHRARQRQPRSQVQATPQGVGRVGAEAGLGSLEDTPMALQDSPEGEGDGGGASSSGGSCGWGLGANVDVLAARAEWQYHCGDFEGCYASTAALLAQDPYATEVLPVHLGCAVQLGKKNELFLRWVGGWVVVQGQRERSDEGQGSCMPGLHSWTTYRPTLLIPCSALSSVINTDNPSFLPLPCPHPSPHPPRGHQLVEAYPKLGLSWFAVGCYYSATRQHEAARRYFARATQLDRSCAPAWVGLGHAYAAQDESDQAMAAYRSAARLFPGLHVPLLGMGMEYGRMNNSALAERCFLEAQRLCPGDAAVAHELGVLAARNRQYPQAARWLQQALALAPQERPAAAEPSLVALAHVMRKQGGYSDAAALLERALGLAPHSAATYAALAFTQQLAGDSAAAVESYHKALGLRPDDSFCNDMLAEALQAECLRCCVEG